MRPADKDKQLLTVPMPAPRSRVVHIAVPIEILCEDSEQVRSIAAEPFAVLGRDDSRRWVSAGRCASLRHANERARSLLPRFAVVVIVAAV
jgi:hypothetical protein